MARQPQSWMATAGHDEIVVRRAPGTSTGSDDNFGIAVAGILWDIGLGIGILRKLVTLAATAYWAAKSLLESLAWNDW